MDNQITLKKLRFSFEALLLFRGILQDDLIHSLQVLIARLESLNPGIFELTGLYAEIGHRLSQTGAGLKTYMIEKILHSETTFSLAAEKKGAECLEGWMAQAVRSDLEHLQAIAFLRAQWLKDRIVQCCHDTGWEGDAIGHLPVWPEQGENDPTPSVSFENSAEQLKTLFLQSACWADCADALAGYHRRWGSGIFTGYKAFVWKKETGGGLIEGIESPDPIRLSDLISYQDERSGVIENTLQFLKGFPANNILLYGDRGTGKSSTIKAILNEFYTDGLRMIEVRKNQLTDFPVITRQLSGRKLKFILFVDDLTFEDHEENYTALKAALEGGLESKPENVLIYATSNRRHLIKENFSDRVGLFSQNADDEIRSADTLQEKLSLSDRFGMTVVFSSPDKARYLEIVEGILKKRGLDIDKEFLHREALKWELWYNGRSPRTARQFADWLEGQYRQKTP